MLSRRDFLKLGAAGLLAVLLEEVALFPAAGRAAGVETAPRLGRVTYSSIRVHREPSFQSEVVGTYRFDTLLEIAEQVRGGEAGDYNRTWYRLREGQYVYSGGIQPVANQLNRPVTDIPAGGVVGELTVPYAESWWAINRNPFPAQRQYYASTHYIEEVVVDRRDGTLWYKAYDHLFPAYYYIRPEFVRLFSAEELAPLSPHLPPEEKYLEVRLDAQVVTAFEGDRLVFWARTATGKGEFATPTGLFRTFHKRPTAHMVGGDGSDSLFDLPGVPFDTYITENGIAFHGTYWHNDFGAPRSHGCINLTPADARWIYRWTLPPVAPGQRFVLDPAQGTLVGVFETSPSPLSRRMR